MSSDDESSSTSSVLPASPPNSSSTRFKALLRFGFLALRVTCSTVAVVALIQEQWVAGGCFGVAWLLLLGAPRVIPQLQPPAESGETPSQP